MATEKIINTRIQLKYDTLANWNANSSLILRKGEVGICAIPTNSSHLQTTPPAIMFKVGDGVVNAEGTVTGTQFKDLPWASALAADVYAWAKKSVPDVNDFGDIIAAARDGLISANSVVKTLNELKGDVTIEPATGEARISVTKNGQKIQFSFAFTDADKAVLNSGITSALVTKYNDYEEEITAAKNAASAAQTTANGKYTKPTGGIPKTDLAEAVQESLNKADSALQSHQTIATGSANGTIAVAEKDVAVKGLAALAYKASLGKADVGLGNVENKTLDTAVTASSGNYITSGAVKRYVDSAIGAVKQFKYEVVNELPSAAAATMGKIYLVAHTHEGTQDGYDEFITIEKDGAYSWEKIGNTDIDLSGYVPTSRKINNKALTADITLAATDVGVNETAFPGLNKVGTVTGVKMNGSAVEATAGVVDLGTVITDISGKQDNLTADQLKAVNSGITSDKVATYDGYAEGKQNKLTTIQMNAVNSGITEEKVTTYDVYADSISALESKPGLDKVGTVTEVTAGVGLKITTGTTAPKVEIDDSVVFVFNCGSATELVD
jgi:hypothetical protein